MEFRRFEGRNAVLIGADTSSFEGFGRQLFVFVGDHVDAEREFIHIGTFSAQIEDADFGVGDTAVEARFRIRLSRDGISIREDNETVHLDHGAGMIWAILDICAWSVLCGALKVEAHLVLAVAITSCRTTSHLVVVYNEQALLANASCDVQSW